MPLVSSSFHEKEINTLDFLFFKTCFIANTVARVKSGCVKGSARLLTDFGALGVSQAVVITGFDHAGSGHVAVFHANIFTWGWIGIETVAVRVTTVFAQLVLSRVVGHAV